MKTKLTNTKYIKGTALSLIAATFLLTGCGSSGIDDVYDRSTETTNYADYSVQVVDDAVKGSKVMANECTGYEEKGEGWYTLTGCNSRPKAIISEGGYITLGDANVSMGFPLIVNTNMIAQSQSYTATPLTTLLATVNDYAELEKLQKSLGFATIQDMFKDDNATRDLQRTLNSFFVEAQNNGVSINNFADFTKDFREKVLETTGTTSGLEAIKQAKTKLKEDFDNNPDKYMNKYGVVFSGFVTNTDYTGTDGSEALLKNIGNKFRGSENQVVFSGFIFDDVIGSSSSKYNQNATITIQDLNTLEFLGLDDDSNTSLQADAYGKYTVKLDKSKIVSVHSYLLKGTTVNTKATPDTSDDINVTLKSILTGDELLSKFKTNLNTADIPDLTISNVTTAKVAILDKLGINLNDTSLVLAGKKELETINKSTLLDVATGIKTIIDGTATISGDTNNTYDYIKTTISNNGTFTQPSDMSSDFATSKAKIEANKTLVTQLTSTTYEKFLIDAAKISGKELTIKIEGDNFLTTIRLFSNGSYTRESKTNDLIPIFSVGKWTVNSGNLTLTNIADDSVSTIALNKLSLAEATYNNAGQFTGTTTNPKGSITKDSISKLIELTTLINIDLTKYSAPMVEFTNDTLKNKRLYEVYPSNGEYEDAVYIFDATGTNVQYSTNAQANTGTQTAISITNGILTIGNDTFKIKKAYPTKLIVTKNGNTSEDIELFYSAVNAAASAQIKTYDNTTYKQARFTTGWSVDTSNNNNGSYNTATISPTPFVLTSVPIGNDKTNYNLSKVSVVSDNFNSAQMIGTKTELAITKNLGDSARQRAKTSTRYILPNFDPTGTNGLLLVDVQLRYNKVVYNLKVRDAEGVDYNILETPITIVEENTLNKKYDVMTVLLDNQIAIRVFDGISSYYQYIDLASLWSSKPTNLKYFKYPTALKNSVNTAYLDDDGTGTLYKGKMNTPIETKVFNFEIINGKSENSYTGGYSPICTVKDKDTTPDNFSFTAISNSEIGTSFTSNSITVNGINAPTTISVIGGLYSLDNGSTWTNTTSTVQAGQTIKVKLTSSTSYSTTTTATLTIGGVSRGFAVTTKVAPTAQTNNTILSSILDESYATTTSFDIWKATDADTYTSLVGIDPSFLGDSSGFGDVWYEVNPYNNKHLGKTSITLNPAPTTTTAGVINFNESEVRTTYINGKTPYTYNTSQNYSNKLTKISTGIYQIYDGTATTSEPREEIKFVKEYTGAELNTLFDSIAPDTNVTFVNGIDKASAITVKVLKDYYEWNEEVQDWSSTTPTTYATLEDFIATSSSHNYWFLSQEGVTNKGIGFASGYTTGQTSGNLSEYSWDSNTQQQTSIPAGTWSITNGILDLNITASGYDYTPAFTVKDEVVWRGEERKVGEYDIGLVYNASALTKLNNYFTNLYGDTTPTTTTPTQTVNAADLYGYWNIYRNNGTTLYGCAEIKNDGTELVTMADTSGNLTTNTITNTWTLNGNTMDINVTSVGAMQYATFNSVSTNEVNVTCSFEEALATYFGTTSEPRKLVKVTSCDTSSTPQTPTEIITTLATQIATKNSETQFKTWGATPTLTQYDTLSGTDVSSFLSGEFGDTWFDINNTTWQDFGTSAVVLNPLPNATTPQGGINFLETKVNKIYINDNWTFDNVINQQSKRIDYISTGVYHIYDDLNATAEEEVKFVKEFDSTELNSMFADVNIIFDTADKAVMILTKALKTYYEWNEVQKDWSSTTPTTYTTLASYITTHSGSGYFISKNGYDNTGIAFASGSTGTSGILVEITNGSVTNTNAGTWSIINGVLDLNITASGYDYTPLFTLKDGLVWRGDKRIIGELNSGLLFNHSALTKLNGYFLGLFNANNTFTPVFTSAMVSGRTVYEVYFDTTSEYDTSANKSIAKFIFDGDGTTTSGTFSATGLYGNDVNSTGSGTWQITTDGKLATTFTGDITGYNTLQTTIPNGIQTSWVAGSETDINYYFFNLVDANSFGYRTAATE